MKAFITYRNQLIAAIESEELEFQSTLTLLEKSQKEVIIQIFQLLYSKNNPQRIGQIMDQVRRDLVLSLNRIDYKRKANLNDPKWKIFLTLNLKLLAQVEEANPQFLNPQQLLPKCLFEELNSEFLDLRIKIQARLKTFRIDPPLQLVVLDCFSCINDFSVFSYHNLTYLRKFSKALLFELSQPSFSEALLLKLLVKLEYNHPAFIAYYKNEVNRAVLSRHEVFVQLAILMEYQKDFSMFKKNDQLKFDLRQKRLSSQLLRYLQLEIKHFKATHINQKSVQVQSQSASQNYQLLSTLSVDGFSYLLRLLVEQEVILANPKIELFRFFAAHLQTCGKKGANPSAESLSTKYKQITQSTATSTKALLLRMLRSIHDNFGI